MQLWSGVPVSMLFEGYVVESLNNNQVAFEVLVENLAGALKSAQFSTECLCKLTKKSGHTYLTFLVEIQSAQIMSVVQDVPIRLLSPTQTALLREPAMGEPEVHIMLPALKASHGLLFARVLSCAASNFLCSLCSLIFLVSIASC
jgi:hypothetical protein